MVEGSTLAVTSQDAYASALRRSTKCMAEVYLISEQRALPPGPKEQVPLSLVKNVSGMGSRSLQACYHHLYTFSPS